MSDTSIVALLDGIESSGEAKYFGFNDDRINDWIINKFQTNDTPEELDSVDRIRTVARMLYPSYDVYLSDELFIKHLSKPELELFHRMKKEQCSRRFVLILHNWADDVLFYDNPDAITRIKMARTSAMRKLLRGESEKEVTREFLLDSGIYQTLADSLGINASALEP